MIAADRCVGQGEEDALADQDLSGEGEADAGATAFGGEEGHENLLANVRRLTTVGLGSSSEDLRAEDRTCGGWRRSWPMADRKICFCPATSM